MTILGRKRRTAPQLCLECGELVTAASGVFADMTPTEGDATLCAYCGCLMIFTADGKLRRPTVIESAALAIDAHVMAAQAAIRRAKKERDQKRDRDHHGDAC